MNDIRCPVCHGYLAIRLLLTLKGDFKGGWRCTDCLLVWFGIDELSATYETKAMGYVEPPNWEPLPLTSEQHDKIAEGINPFA